MNELQKRYEDWDVKLKITKNNSSLVFEDRNSLFKEDDNDINILSSTPIEIRQEVMV